LNGGDLRPLQQIIWKLTDVKRGTHVRDVTSASAVVKSPTKHSVISNCA
jgi:hypothetical protein